MVVELRKRKLRFGYPLLSGRLGRVRILEEGRVIASARLTIGRRVEVKFAKGAEAKFKPRGVWRQVFVLESSDLKAKVRAVWSSLDFFEPLHIRVEGWDIRDSEDLLVAFLLLFYLCWVRFP